MRRMESSRPTGRAAAITFMRVLLQLLNVVLAVCGVAVLMYSTYMFAVWHTDGYSKEVTPWFIYVFGAAGLFTFLTAVAGLVGSARNSRFLLAVYAFMAVLLLLAQVAVALLLFLGKTWHSRLPHDDTGEAHKLERWIKHRINVCRWVGLALLIVQVVAVIVAFLQSRTQQQALRSESTDDDEVWGHRQPLLASQEALVRGPARVAPPNDLEAAVPMPDRNDPWSQRMRDKYGLDTDQFTQVPAGTADNLAADLPQLATHSQPQADGNGSRCVVM